MPILLQISLEVNSGSVGRIAEQIGETAIQCGWESYITYARRNQASKSKLIKIGTYWDVYWHGIMTRIFDNHALCSKRATRQFIKEVDKIKPDIIQIHHIHGYFINMRILFDYLSSLKIPIVWVFHDCWSITGHCAYFDYVRCEKWKRGCYECVQKEEYPASWVFDRSEENYFLKKKLFNSIDNLTIVPVSYWLEEIMRESFLKGHKIQVIQNGIDLDVFAPRNNNDEIRKKYNIGSRTMLLGVASTWESRKGLKDFIKLQTLIDVDSVIVLVGLSRRQIERLPDGMIGIMRTENVQELAELYSATDVFINLTWEDTFPTTNLEALACGIPVVTYRTGGSVESISSETGFVVEQGDLDSVWQVVGKIRKKGKGFYSKNCRERAKRLYNRNDRFKDYIQLYSVLLSYMNETV